MIIRDGQYNDVTEDVVGDDGSISCNMPYVNWGPGAEIIHLDGLFYIEDLEKIIKHVKRINASR